MVSVRDYRSGIFDISDALPDSKPIMSKQEDKRGQHTYSTKFVRTEKTRTYKHKVCEVLNKRSTNFINVT